MATNTLTNLIPAIYGALDVISRELVGLIPAVTVDANANRVAQNQTLYLPVNPASSAADITPAATPPALSGQTIGNKSVTINKYRRVFFSWEGEEQAAVNAGPGFQSLLQGQFAQAMRTLTNEIEADLAALYTQASRAYGTAGTAPFGTAGDYSDGAQIRKILADNGAPLSDLQLVVNTAAGANLRGKQGGRGVDLEGTTALLRQGVLQDIHGFMVRESAQIKDHTKGTGASSTTDNAGYAVGSTSLTLASAGTGTLLAGDVVTFAGDTANKYVVTTGDADVSNGGTLVLGAPGLRVAMSAATKAITVGNSYAANLAFARSALLLATRLPRTPDGGDLARDRRTVTDPVSGLSFEVAMYPGYHANSYEVSIAWGVACLKPEHLAILLG
jgi:hypothetical protein